MRVPAWACGLVAVFLMVCSPALADTAFDPERDIGLAGVHPDEGPCLAIRSERVPTGAGVTLVNPLSQKILIARVAGSFEGRCVSGSYPTLLGDHDDSVYLLELLEGTVRPDDLLIATLVPPSRFAVRGPRVRAELDGREPEESFRLCLSAEGVHLTVWSGEPLAGRRRWHEYHHLGFELDEEEQDCSEADYAEFTSVELSRHEPDVTYVEEETQRFGYDAALLQRSEGEAVARWIEQQHGESAFPLIYCLPEVDGFFLVSAGVDGDDPEDYGARFLLLREENGRLETVFRGRGMRDSYILRPTFYTGAGKSLILAETGTEYSWGLQAYELADGTLGYLESLDVASWTGENYDNPLERAGVFAEDSGYRVEFYSDLVMDPGGLRPWSVTRPADTITFTQVEGRFALSPDSVSGQACFFFVAGTEGQGAIEALSDLDHYYGQMISWMERHRLSHSFQSDAPIEMIPVGENPVVIERDELTLELGVVLLAEDGRQKILYGVHTDLDLVSEMVSFFGIEE